MCTLSVLLLLEDGVPTIKDLNRHVAKKFAADWEDIGLELGLELGVLKIVAKDNPQQSVACCREVLDKWLKSTPSASWRTLEVALTNVRRQALQLDSVDDVYGKNSIHICVSLATYVSILVMCVIYRYIDMKFTIMIAI